MTKNMIKPTKCGQIVKIIKPLDDEDPSTVYIVCEDPNGFDENDAIYISDLNELQRNIFKPLSTPQISVIKSELTVIADDLETYVKSWNKE
jgi:hypothetical protein